MLIHPIKALRIFNGDGELLPQFLERFIRRKVQPVEALQKGSETKVLLSLIHCSIWKYLSNICKINAKRVKVLFIRGPLTDKASDFMQVNHMEVIYKNPTTNILLKQKHAEQQCGWFWKRHQWTRQVELYPFSKIKSNWKDL